MSHSNDFSHHASAPAGHLPNTLSSTPHCCCWKAEPASSSHLPPSRKSFSARIHYWASQPGPSGNGQCKISVYIFHDGEWKDNEGEVLAYTDSQSQFCSVCWYSVCPCVCDYVVEAAGHALALPETCAVYIMCYKWMFDDGRCWPAGPLRVPHWLSVKIR